MSKEQFELGLQFIAETDQDFAHALSVISPIPSRKQPAGFQQLCKIIVEQQVSLASAAAIWGRMVAAVDPFTPAKVLAFTTDELRSFGLSRQKANYCQALAVEIEEERLALDHLMHHSDEEAQAALTSVKGIGRWTAEIYLISCLSRTDIWPAGDVALQIALQHLKKMDTRPTIKEMDIHAEPFRPYRTYLAQILWRYYSDIVKPPPKGT